MHATVTDKFSLQGAEQAQAKAAQAEALLNQVETLLRQIEQHTSADLPFTEIEDAQAMLVVAADDFKEAIDAYYAVDEGKEANAA